ncbi:two-component response regulator-like APRR5 [Asparagus officinalis]|uniref:two-component response regulator-like APRR5 n=1 Tax=Asparagus officinalis TaxID=4686 RepID=UPI00098DF411|nr:two-component response regulator-like APRR5 [Asparagus officinalis]
MVERAIGWESLTLDVRPRSQNREKTPALTGASTLHKPHLSTTQQQLRGSAPFFPAFEQLLHAPQLQPHSFTHSVPDPAPNPFFSSSSPPSSVSDFLDFHHEPVRRVYSTGDLQASTENCVQDGSATVGRVGRYTAEERMKKIERYRSKRNQRNFHKKITYACRKTLADSRPRVRGRFARNGEPEAETEQELGRGAETSYGSYTNNRGNRETSYESYTCNRHGNKKLPTGGLKIPATTLATTDEEEEFSYSGEDLWASFDGVFSMNLLS